MVGAWDKVDNKAGTALISKELVHKCYYAQFTGEKTETQKSLTQGKGQRWDSSPV